MGTEFQFWQLFLPPVVTSGIAVCIATVGAGYSLLLRHLWDPEGLQRMADIILHDAVALMYVVSWVLFVPKSTLRWKSVLLWLIYPLAYVSCILLRGALVERYPYPFLNAAGLGYPRVLSNVAMLLCGFSGIGLFVVAISRWTVRRRTSDVA